MTNKNNQMVENAVENAVAYCTIVRMQYPSTSWIEVSIGDLHTLEDAYIGLAAIINNWWYDDDDNDDDNDTTYRIRVHYTNGDTSMEFIDNKYYDLIVDRHNAGMDDVPMDRFKASIPIEYKTSYELVMRRNVELTDSRWQIIDHLIFRLKNRFYNIEDALSKLFEIIIPQYENVNEFEIDSFIYYALLFGIRDKNEPDNMFIIDETTANKYYARHSAGMNDMPMDRFENVMLFV